MTLASQWAAAAQAALLQVQVAPSARLARAAQEGARASLSQALAEGAIQRQAWWHQDEAAAWAPEVE